MSNIKFRNEVLHRVFLPLCYRLLRASRSAVVRGANRIVLSASGVLAAVSPAAAADSGNGDISSASFLAFVLIGVLALGVIIIGSLVIWTKKQDEINNIMFFCIKYFINTKDATERCNAAIALGRAKDPEALLVLIDVVNDKKVEKIVRNCAREALGEMRQHYRKYKTVIDELIVEVERKDRQKIIDIVIANFENGEKKYLQSAYVIGREFMALGQYEAAREWLFRAQIRNKKESIYQEQISDDISKCNQQLFAEGDELFRKGDYYAAKEHYTLSATGLEDEEKRRFAAHLRLACVYCKLGDYVDADQSLLQALQHHHETDSSLSMIKVLQNVLNTSQELEVDKAASEKKIDECVTEVIEKLFSND